MINPNDAEWFNVYIGKLNEELAELTKTKVILLTQQRVDEMNRAELENEIMKYVEAQKDLRTE